MKKPNRRVAERTWKFKSHSRRNVTLATRSIMLSYVDFSVKVDYVIFTDEITPAKMSHVYNSLPDSSGVMTSL